MKNNGESASNTAMARQERVKAALRENLKRRKQKARDLNKRSQEKTKPAH